MAGRRSEPVADAEAFFAERAADGFVGGLSAEQMDGLFDDGEEGVIKADSPAGGGAAKPTSDLNQSAQALEAAEQGRELLRQAEAELAMTRVEIERLKADAGNDIEVMKRVAAEEARGRGYTEGFDKGVAEIEKLRAGLTEERSKLRSEYDRLVDELEPRFVGLLTDIYEQIFQVELTEYGPIVAHLVTNTMRNSNESKDFIVRVARKDYDYVNSMKTEIANNAALGKASLEIIADITLAPGECLIETGGGVFDCGLGTQLQGLNQKLKLLSFEA